ncbi:hypothetical protein KKD19_04015 [Patescibacteria group bacterium]|nr:hypothetical protein [Patescibacteria group bacterium]
MEDKKIINKNNPQSKIKWHHRRWFWGAVLGVVFVLVCWSGIDYLSDINPNYKPWNLISSFFFQLPTGLFIITGVKGSTTMFYQLIYTQLSKAYLVIYYITLLGLLFKTLQRKKVKIRYPLILLTIIIISSFGFTLLNAFSS